VQTSRRRGRGPFLILIFSWPSGIDHFPCPARPTRFRSAKVDGSRKDSRKATAEVTAATTGVLTRPSPRDETSERTKEKQRSKHARSSSKLATGQAPTATTSPSQLTDRTASASARYRPYPDLAEPEKKEKRSMGHRGKPFHQHKRTRTYPGPDIFLLGCKPAGEFRLGNETR